MARKRSTLDLHTIKRLANVQLARKDVSVEARKAVAGLLEAMLFEANAYEGYNHIYWTQTGHKLWTEAGRPEGQVKNQYIYGPDSDGTDDYRRYYY